MHQLTAGNPLFLATAIDHLVRKGYIVDSRDGCAAGASRTLAGAVPASLASTVTRALEELAGDERQAIDAASVVGTEFSLWLAAHAADMDELALEPVFEMLARRGRSSSARAWSSSPTASSVRLPVTHGLYQEMVLEHTDPKTRADAHGRAGHAMNACCRPRARSGGGPGLSLPRRRRPPPRGPVSSGGGRQCPEATPRAKPRRSSTAPSPMRRISRPTNAHGWRCR